MCILSTTGLLDLEVEASLSLGNSKKPEGSKSSSVIYDFFSIYLSKTLLLQITGRWFCIAIHCQKSFQRFPEWRTAQYEYLISGLPEILVAWMTIITARKIQNSEYLVAWRKKKCPNYPNLIFLFKWALFKWAYFNCNLLRTCWMDYLGQIKKKNNKTKQ